jgi:hypothetical protein
MVKTTEFDANNAFVQVRQEIKSLMDFNVADNQDDVMYAANKLISVLRMVQDNYLSWSVECIREFVLDKNDPLRNIDFKSDQFSNSVRMIQQDIIVQFS